MNIELSKNNHMVVGYNDIPWSFRTDLYDQFFVKFGKVEKNPGSFREVCVQSAIEISETSSKLNKKPLILYSGGIDSEVIIIAFLLSGKPFDVAHVKYFPDLNSHETAYVRRFCDRHKINLKEFTVDPIEFFSRSDTLFNAEKDNARLIELQLITSITDSIKDEYFPVSDHPGVMLFRDNLNLREKSKWYWKDFEHLSAYYFHCLRNNVNACPSFYHWSPEIILSFLLDPMIRDLTNNIPLGKITIRTTTLPFYQNNFPDFEIEERLKYNGFEFIPKKIINHLNQQLNSKTLYDRHSGQIYEYNELIKLLS